MQGMSGFPTGHAGWFRGFGLLSKSLFFPKNQAPATKLVETNKHCSFLQFLKVSQFFPQFRIPTALGFEDLYRRSSKISLKPVLFNDILVKQVRPLVPRCFSSKFSTMLRTGPFLTFLPGFTPSKDEDLAALRSVRNHPRRECRDLKNATLTFCNLVFLVFSAFFSISTFEKHGKACIFQ